MQFPLFQEEKAVFQFLRLLFVRVFRNQLQEQRLRACRVLPGREGLLQGEQDLMWKAFTMLENLLDKSTISVPFA